MATAEHKEEALKAALVTLETAAKSVFKHSKTIRDLQNVNDELARLKDEVASKVDLIASRDSQIAGHDALYAQMRQTFADQYREWKEDQTKWDRARKDLENGLQNKNQKLERLQKQHEVKYLAADAQISELKGSLKRSEEEYDRVRNSLRQFNASIGLESLDHSVLAMEFRNLSNRLHEISLNWAGSAPGQKPNQETTDYSPPSRATIVKSFEPLRIPFPVPISKSDASKVLRAAAFEFIVCHFLTAEIFRVLPPAYPFERGPIEDFLAELVTRDPGLESLLRPALISAAGKERVDQETIASTMARETLEVCRQSIPHFHPTEDLEMVTQSFFVSCLDTWMRAQRCRRRVVASSIVDTPMSQWNPWDALGSPVEPDTENQAMQTEPLDPEVVLFPQIVATDMAGKPSGVLFEGCLMWGDELLVMQGRLEYRRFCDKKRARRDSMMSKRRDSLASRDTPTRVEERKRA